MLTTIFLCLMGMAHPAAPASPPTLPDIIPEGYHSVKVDRSVDSDLLHERCCVQYTIQKGDTFEKLARKHLGAAGRVHDLTALNPKVDPRRLKIGARIWLPPRDANAPNRFVYVNTWPRNHQSRPFGIGDRVYAHYGELAFVIVDEAHRAEFVAAKDWKQVVKMQDAKKLQALMGSSVRGTVRDGSPVRRIREHMRFTRDAKDRYALDIEITRFDAKGQAIPAKASGAQKKSTDQMWLLLFALGGATLIWLRMRQGQRLPSHPALA